MAAARKRDEPTSITALPNAPLIALLVNVDGHDVVRYFTSEEDAEAAISDEDIEQAVATFGAWSDLDADEVLAELDRIRHESPPTPPIDLDESRTPA
jgi:hypothetical protein